MLAEPAQLHGVGDHIHPGQAGHNQRQKDGHAVFQSLDQLFLLAQFHAAGLLGLTDVVIVALDVGDVAQRDAHRIADAVGHADLVQAGGKLAGIGGGDEENRHRQRHEVFQGNVEHVKQLLAGHVIAARDVQEHMPRPIDLAALVGIEKVDEKVVKQQKHQHEHQHEPHLTDANAA